MGLHEERIVAAGGSGRDVGAGDSDAAVRAQSFVRHELRTPLAVMRPVLDMLLDGTAGALSQKQLDYLRMLDRNVERLAAMITSVAESGWLDVAARQAADEDIPVGDLVGQTVRDVETATSPCPRLTTQVPGSLPALRGDPPRLGRALRNVVVNACTFTPPDGIVAIAARPAGAERRVLLVVEDTGCGISSDELASVFELGFQGEAARGRAGRGLGLGLFVAREVVHAHGGRIWIESAPGQGTQVSLELPTL